MINSKLLLAASIAADILDFAGIGQWPTAALLDWWSILRRVEAIPVRPTKLEQVQNLLRGRLVQGGTTLKFSTDESDFWWWLMDSPDGNAARLLEESGAGIAPQLYQETLSNWQAIGWAITSTLLLLALRVSGLSVGNAGDTYKVYAYFDNIAGVTVRGKVTLAGVTIGKVTAVDLDRDSYTGRVTMEINQNVNNLPVDSTASILTAGLLGEKYIGISVGGDEDVLKDGSTIHDTQSALVLEDLIGKFLLNSVNKDEAKK